MTDEKFVFITDCADKKRTARGAYNKKVGKNGKVKFPSDYMTRKELDAMNGEVVTYQLNKPMKWSEYKKMPDDIRRQYIENLQKRYDIPKNLASVLVWDGVDNDVFTGHYSKYGGWMIDGFYDEDYHFEITHWMPRPKPPKGEA